MTLAFIASDLLLDFYTRPRTLPEPARGSPFTQGFVTNVLNPKVAMFMLAFLPQFVVPSRGNAGIQIVLLGLIWAAFGLVVLTVVAFAGASVAAVRRRSRVVRIGERYVTGGIFIGLGLRIIVPGRG
jgi:threonine/homoserine/homoserine lactone efflux protein